MSSLALRPVTLQLDSLEPRPEASSVAIAPHVCSVATEVYHQFLGQDFHLLDDDAFTAPVNSDTGRRRNKQVPHLGAADVQPPSSSNPSRRCQYVCVANYTWLPGTQTEDLNSTAAGARVVGALTGLLFSCETALLKFDLLKFPTWHLTVAHSKSPAKRSTSRHALNTFQRQDGPAINLMGADEPAKVK
jgi:hypothetical protein